MITIPAGALVATVGASGSGKTSAMRLRFQHDAIISSDAVRNELLGDGSIQDHQAFVWRHIYERIGARLARGLVTVLDSTMASQKSRAALVEFAHSFGAPLVLLVFHPPLAACLERNWMRGAGDGRSQAVPDEVIQRQWSMVESWNAQRGDDDDVHLMTGRPLPSIQVDYAPRAVTPVATQPDAPHERYAIIGDVHGCAHELAELLSALAQHGAPDDRKLVFVGDLHDRGPANVSAIMLARDLIRDGVALGVLGNHEHKLRRFLGYVLDKGLPWDGTPMQTRHGLDRTVSELRGREFLAAEVLSFLATLPYHLVLDHGRLVVSHAGIPEHLIGREGRHLEPFALYGNPTGEKDDRGFPIRRNLADSYSGPALQVHGHIVVEEPTQRHNVVNIDTGCVFGGRLTAMLYPEREFVSVPARSTYWNMAGGGNGGA